VPENITGPRRETLQRPPQKGRFGLQKIIFWDVVEPNCIVIPEKRFGRFGRLNVLKHASGGYMGEIISPAEQVTRVATLLGRAVLRWKREKEQSSEISEIVSDSLPERLEFSPVSSLSVTGQNDEATGLGETGSESEMNSTNHMRGATNKDRGLDRRSDLATREQVGIKFVLGRVFDCPKNDIGGIFRLFAVINIGLISGQGKGNSLQQRGNPKQASRNQGNRQSGARENNSIGGALMPAQVEQLIRMREEEKLAHDVYVTLAQTSGLQIFNNIANSESQHMRAVDQLVSRYSPAIAESSTRHFKGSRALAESVREPPSSVHHGVETVGSCLYS
jgi:Uncharacterized protein domain (DUF2202)